MHFTRMSDTYKTVRFIPSETRAALVVAHPGHELLVHGWLEAARPRVFVLTDGSGHSNQSRLSSTTRILDQAGAKRGGIYGGLTDSAAYKAILNREFEPFIGFARELTSGFVNEQIDFVAGDALEGYNPMHDVCRLIINTSVAVARRVHRREIANFEFSLVNQPHGTELPPHANEICLRLDETTLARKISIAQGYAELAGEVSTALGATVVTAFGVERLRPVESETGARRCDNEIPFYELYGEKQVALGHYTEVLRYEAHIAPLADALRTYAKGNGE
jgi:hypothetical protein